MLSLNIILLNNLTALIQASEMSEAQCLAKCGIHRNFMSNLRKGTLKHPSFECIYALAKFFNVSIDSLTQENYYTVLERKQFNIRRKYIIHTH